MTTRSARRGLLTVPLALAMLLASAGSAQAMPGDLDPAFGGGDGMQQTHAGHADERALAVARLPNGELLVVGMSEADVAQGDVVLVKYLENGELDPSFGDPATPGYNLVATPGHDDFPVAVLRLPTGKILVVAYTLADGANRSKLALYRFSPAGLLDTAFGDGDGIELIAFPNSFGARAAALLSSGKVVVAGEYLVNKNGDSEFLVARLRGNLVLDTSFGGGDGFVTTQFRAGFDLPTRVAEDAEGRIVAVGGSEEGVQTGELYDVAVARYTSDGSADRTFSGDGRLITQVYEDHPDLAVGLGLQGSAIVVAVDGDGFVLLRYRSNGALDSSFGGGDGVVLTRHPQSHDVAASDLVVDSSGRVVVAGIDFEGTANGQIAVARYLAGGRVDKTFGGGDGFTGSSFADGASPSRMTLAGGGKIVVVGGTNGTVSFNPDLAVARFLP